MKDTLRTQRLYRMKDTLKIQARRMKDTLRMQTMVQQKVRMKMLNYNLDIQHRGLKDSVRMIQRRRQVGRNQQFIEPIIRVLLDERVITDDQHLSFTLNQDGLIVNGVRQPAELFERFRKEYLTNPQNEIIYAKKDGSESTTIKQVK